MTPISSGSNFRTIDFSEIDGLPSSFDTLIVYARDSTHSNPNRDSKFFLSDITFGGGGGASVPEPSTLGLLCLGLAGLALVRTRKRMRRR